MAVPDTDHYRAALAHGDTLARRPHIHWVDRSKLAWIERERARSVVVAVELADDATPLTRLEPARRRTVVRRPWGNPVPWAERDHPVLDALIDVVVWMAFGWQKNH